MKNIVIIGAGGHAKVVADIILKRKEILKEELNVIGFLDDNFQDLEYKEIFNIPLLGNTDLIKEFKNKNYEYIIAVGNNLVRKKIAEKYSELNYYTAVHPMAVIGNEVKIEKGTVVMANAVINSYSKIGKHCILNTSCIIEHDNRIGNYTHISVNAKTGGTVTIGKCSWLGISATVKNNIYICDNCMIGAGGVVVKNINEAGTYIGVPAERLEMKKEKMNGGGVNPSKILYLEIKKNAVKRFAA